MKRMGFGRFSDLSVVLISCSPLIRFFLLCAVMVWKWPIWLIHASCWETNEEPELSGETSSSLQVQSLWLTAARHDLTHCMMINVVSASPSCSSWKSPVSWMLKKTWKDVMARRVRKSFYFVLWRWREEDCCGHVQDVRLSHGTNHDRPVTDEL